MAIHIHPLDVPPRYYKPLGQIVVGWNLTEQFIQSIIWHFHKIRSPKIGRLFTYRPSSVEKLEMLKVTFEQFVADAAIKKELHDLHSAANKLRPIRNKYAHGFWGRMPTEHKTWKVFYSRGTGDTFLLRRDVAHLQDLKNTAAEVRQLNVRFRRFMQKHGVPPP